MEQDISLDIDRKVNGFCEEDEIQLGNKFQNNREMKQKHDHGTEIINNHQDPLPRKRKRLKLRISLPHNEDGVHRAYMVDPYYEDKTECKMPRRSTRFSNRHVKYHDSMEAYQSNIKVRVRLPRSKMPYRWREPLQPIKSCLEEPVAPMSPMSPSSLQISNVSILKRALSHHDEVDQDSWLTSSFIDLIFSKFARTYKDAHFMPVEFAAFRLKATAALVDLLHITDILGNNIEYRKKKSVIFFANIQNMHWNLIRVEHFPFPEVQLFEPMGKPEKRGGGAGVSSRGIPQNIIHWLDTCWPLESKESWLQHTYSAVTKQHQITGFDCGVACLLYAEKCGVGQPRQDIDEYTTQKDITDFRQILMQCFGRFCSK